MTLSARHALVHRRLSRRRARRPAAAARRRRPLGQARPAECRCSWSSWCRNGGPLCGLRRHAAPRQIRDERLSHRTTVGIVTMVIRQGQERRSISLLSSRLVFRFPDRTLPTLRPFPCETVRCPFIRAMEEPGFSSARCSFPASQF